MPASKTPSLVVMLGNAGRGTLLADALSTTRERVTCRASEGMSLQLDPATAFSDRPMLIAHEDISRRRASEAEPMAAPCHRQTVRELQWQVDSLAEASDSLYRRLVRPFTDVVCFFSVGSRDIHHQIDRMLPWLEQTPSQGPHITVHPRILLVAAPSEERNEASVLAQLSDLLHTRLKQPTSEMSSRISVYVRHASNQTLTDRIKREADIARNDRVCNYTILNAVHFNLFFSQACDHFVSSERASFDMLAASRSHRPVSTQLQTYISVLLDSVDNVDDMTEFVVPFVAGSLVVDNYAYDVPFFDPQKVFSAHYKLACLEAAVNKALNSSRHCDRLVLLLRTQIVSLIEQRFLQRSKVLCANPRASLLAEFQPWLAVRKFYQLCLGCMQAEPEQKLTCGHLICERCFTRLGTCSQVDPHLYKLSCCPFCSQSCHASIRVKPVTAGFRVLSIDGGGIRAAIPIQFLCALEKAVGLDMPIQELFDLGYGTSSGAMVILALYGLGMRAEETFSLFNQLSTRIFRGRSKLGLGLAATAHALIASCRNGRFPASDIDNALAEIFGEATMLDHQYMSSIGARIGFPVVDVYKLKTCLVTSYNGTTASYGNSACTKMSTYRVLRSEGAVSEIRMKDATRCTSAAPWYFTPHKMPHHGTFMDGGLSDNNPCMLAMQELQKMVPGLSRADHFVSVGTGTSTTREVAKADVYPSLLFGNSSLQQTLQHYWSENFDGDRQFAIMRQMLAMSLPGGDANIDEWLHRFNLPIDGELPDLANASAIGSLAERAYSYFTANPAVRDLADAVLASSFYFELWPGRMPIYERGSYSCHGRVRCRIPSNNPAFSTLMQKLDILGAKFQIQMQVCDSGKAMSTWLDRFGNFSKPVCVRVPSLEDELDIRMRLHGDRVHQISASPLTFKTLIKLQMLEWSALENVQAATSDTSRKRRRDESPVRATKRDCLDTM
ncbi:Patatin [Pyrenophora tritici-repentis]|nr:Patatin [Pyrenophora tritici-repentis]